MRVTFVPPTSNRVLFDPPRIARRLTDGKPYERERSFPARPLVRRFRPSVGQPIPMTGDGPGGEPKPANDNFGGGRWPLEEEFKAGRLGKYAEENETLWSAACWFDCTFDTANRPPEAAPCSLNRFGLLEDLDGYEEEEPLEGHEIERVPLAGLGKTDPNSITANVRKLGTLNGAEVRIEARRICQRIKANIGPSGYCHLVDAVAKHREMKEIGEGEGFGQAIAGRMLVRAALRAVFQVRCGLQARIRDVA